MDTRQRIARAFGVRFLRMGLGAEGGAGAGHREGDQAMAGERLECISVPILVQHSVSFLLLQNMALRPGGTVPLVVVPWGTFLLQLFVGAGPRGRDLSSLSENSTRTHIYCRLIINF